MASNLLFLKDLRRLQENIRLLKTFLKLSIQTHSLHIIEEITKMGQF